MKKNIFEVNEEEKRRILEMHIDATLKQYLMEQLDPRFKPTKDWKTIANLLMDTYGATCYIENSANKESSATRLSNAAITKSTWCELRYSNKEDKSNQTTQYSTGWNFITFRQYGSYTKTIDGYNAGSGNYSLSKDRKNLIDTNTQVELIDASLGGKSKCPFKNETEILGFRAWLNYQYPELAAKLQVEKDRKDCTEQVIKAAYFIKEGRNTLYQDWLKYSENSKKNKEEYDKQFSAEVEDAKSYANPDSTQVYDTSGKALGYSHERKISEIKHDLGLLEFVMNADGDTLVNLISLLAEAIPEFGTAISLGIDFIHAMSYFIRAFFVEEYSKEWWYYVMMGWIQGTVGLVPAVGNIQMFTVQKLGEKMLAGIFKKSLEKFGGTFGIATIAHIDTLAWAYKLIKTYEKGTATPQSIGMTIVNMTNKIQEWIKYCQDNDKYVPDNFEKILQDVYEVFSGSLGMSEDQWNQVDEAVKDL